MLIVYLWVIPNGQTFVIEEMYGSYEYCPHCRRKVVRDGD